MDPPLQPENQERHNIEMLKSSPYVNMGSKRTPRIALAPNPHSYEISPYRCGAVLAALSMVLCRLQT